MPRGEDVADGSIAREIPRTLLSRAGWILRHGTGAALLAVAASLPLPWTWDSTAVLLPADRRTDTIEYRAGRAGLTRFLESLRLKDRTHPQEIDQAILLGETTKRTLVDRLDLTTRWRTSTKEEAVRRLDRALTLELVPYGPMLLHARTEDRTLSANLANEAARLLEERLDALRLESVRSERGFVTEAIREELAEAASLEANLAAYDAEHGIAGAAIEAKGAVSWAVDRAAALAAARVRRAEAVSRFGAGSAEEADAAAEVEGRRAAEERIPSAAAAREAREPRQEEVRRAERVARLLGALRGQTWTSQAVATGDVRLLDEARPAERPSLRPFAMAALLAFAAVPSAALLRRFAPAPLVQPFAGRPSLLVAPAAALLGILFAREPILLAAVLVAAYVLVLVSNLRVAWFLLLLIVPWAWDFIDEARGFSIQIPTEPGIIALVGAWFYAIALRGGVRLPKSRILTAAFLTIAWTAIAAIPSVYPKHSIFQLVAVTGFALVGCVFPILEVRDVSTVRALVIATIASSVVFSLYGLVQVLGSPLSLDRAAFFMGDPFFDNHGPFAAYVAFGFAAAFAFAATTRPGERRGPILVSLAVITVGLVVSLTRAAWIAVAAVLVIAAATRLRAFLKSAIPAIAALAVAVPILLAVTGGTASFENYLQNAVDPEYASNVERLNRWRAGVAMTLARPVTGVGPGAYPIAYETYRDAAFLSTHSDRRMGAHMEVLRAASEQGIPGMVIYVFLLAATLGTALRLARRSADPEVRRLALALGCGVFMLAVHGLFNEYWRVPEVTLVFWSFAGLVGALERIDSGPGPC